MMQGKEHGVGLRVLGFGINLLRSGCMQVHILTRLFVKYVVPCLP